MSNVRKQALSPAKFHIPDHRAFFIISKHQVITVSVTCAYRSKHRVIPHVSSSTRQIPIIQPFECPIRARDTLCIPERRYLPRIEGRRCGQ